MNFDLYMPVRLLTGRGVVRRNASALAGLGNRCLIVTSGSAARKSGALDDITAALDEAGVAHALFDRVRQNPLLTDCHEAGGMAREFGARFIVGIGGGSPLDTAKAAAVFAANPAMEPLDVYKGGWPNPALPLVLIGTTAGTGSEVAPFSVLTKPDGRKQSFASEQCYARIAFGDPGYIDSLPRAFTVSTALDALSHALEGYFSTAASAISDLHAVEAVRLLVPALTALREIGGGQVPLELRDTLYYASVLAGFTLAHCGTCYCHCLGYFLSEEHGVPHGTACAVTLPDFVRRAGRVTAEKAGLLYDAARCTEDELCALIESLLDIPEIALSAAGIEEIVARNEKSGNFARTAPDGYTREEAIALLTSLYGGGMGR